MADKKEPKIFLCKYKIDNLVFFLEDTKLVLDHSNVLTIEYMNDYEFNIRSIFKVTVRIDIRKKLWLLKNKKDIVCKIELSKFGMDTDMEESVTSLEECINQEFGIFFNDEDDAIDTKVLEERLKLNSEANFDIDDIEDENYYETQNLQDVYLFNRTLLNASTKTYNEIYTKNTLQQCVGRLLTATKHKHVLMSPFENNEIYKELLVPANPSYKGLIYLDQYYGFYQKGAMIFYDIDTLYILNPNGKVTAKREDEWTETTFLVTQMDSSTPGNGMIRKEGEKIFYISLNEMCINPQKFTIDKNVTAGSEAKIVIADGITANIEEADQSYIDQRNQSIAYTKKANNKYLAQILKARMEENECILYISGNNFDINAFTPNKQFQVIFDETLKQEKYGKYKYRLAYAYHCIKLTSTHYMDSSHHIILKKCGS